MVEGELSVDDFDAFFKAIHDQQPFPWQKRLLCRVASTDRFPGNLHLPTGTGKTAIIDMAVFALALGIDLPRRVVFVVDRRVIVHQAAKRARLIAERIESADEQVLAAVRARLRALGGSGRKTGDPVLQAVELRGGIPSDDSWALRPDLPAVIASTVDQVGSRLLFRGYGVGRRARPIHAGLLGNDTLFVLDEVHLAPAFARLLATIKERYRPPSSVGLPDRWQVVELTATPVDQAETFGLDSDDQADAVLRRRLSARKPATLRPVTKKRGNEERDQLALAAADAAWGLLKNPHARSIGVIVNRVDTARRVHRLLQARAKSGETDPGVDVILLTGRMRSFDRDDLLISRSPDPTSETYEARLATGHTRSPSDRPLILVSTQAIEAGADFDLDLLVSECASLDALVQRFGRVDRAGELTARIGAEAAPDPPDSHPESVILAGVRALKAPSDPIYGTALAATWKWLSEQGSLDLGAQYLPDPGDRRADLYADRPAGPLLFDTQMDTWVQTLPVPDADPDIALWLHGRADPETDVTLIWRADLTAQVITKHTWLAQRVVAVCPPGLGEALQVPLSAVRAWLTPGAEQPGVGDVEAPTDQDVAAPRSGEFRPALRWTDREHMEVVGNGSQIRPGDTLIVPASYGGIGAGTWDPTDTNPVVDHAERVELIQRNRTVKRLIPEVLPPELASPPKPALDDPDVDHHTVVTSWLKDVARPWLRATERTDPDGNDPVGRILRGLVDSPIQVEVISRGRELDAYYVISRRPGSGGGRAFAGTPIELDRHLENVRRWAGNLANGCALPEHFCRDLALVGYLHDLGKADPRFQRVLRRFLETSSGALLAKSGIDPRTRLGDRDGSGYPRDARHELLTVSLVQHHNEIRTMAYDWDLVLHLIASHHGYARPFVPFPADFDPVPVMVEWAGIPLAGSSDYDLARLNSGVSQRFWRLVERYGHYGLAWLEAIFRLADHRASEEEQDPEGEVDEGGTSSTIKPGSASNGETEAEPEPVDVRLDGLRGNNPLGFLAALGVLSVLERAQTGRAVTLRWTTDLVPRAVITGADSTDHLIELIAADLDTWRNGRLLRWPPSAPAPDVKVDSDTFAEWSEQVWTAPGPHSEQAELFCALVAWDAFAGDGRSKPTHLHFTAGRQMFLDMARDLIEGMKKEDFQEAIVGPWKYASRLPSFSWEAGGERTYAHRATDPSTEKRLSVPGAEWLALLGLSLLPVATINRSLRTTACDTAWKRSAFRWPVWIPALERRTVRSLLADPSVVGEREERRRHSPDVLGARGIRAVYQAGIRRTEQGGYGSFTAPTTLAIAASD